MDKDINFFSETCFLYSYVYSQWSQLYSPIFILLSTVLLSNGAIISALQAKVFLFWLHTSYNLQEAISINPKNIIGCPGSEISHTFFATPVGMVCYSFMMVSIKQNTLFKASQCVFIELLAVFQRNRPIPRKRSETLGFISKSFFSKWPFNF